MNVIVRKIPRILHFIWVGDESQRPDNCIDTWRKHHSDWEIKVWGNRTLVDQEWVNARHMKEMSARELNGVADMMRWEILYNEGGVVLDADSICLRPLEDAFLENDSFCCWENETARPGFLAAGYFGSCAQNEFVGQIILDIQQEESVVNDQAWKTVGPLRLTKSYLKYKYTALEIYPSHFFIPEHYTGMKYNGSGPIYAAQLWGTIKNIYESLHKVEIPELKEGKVISSVAMTASAPAIASSDFEFNQCSAYFINLSHRADRALQLMRNLEEMSFSREEFLRIEAVLDKDFGGLGCAKSHILTLTRFICESEKSYCLILEDDFNFRVDRAVVEAYINAVVSVDPNWQVALLAGTLVEAHEPIRALEGLTINKVYTSQSTAGYIVRREYVSKLIDVYFASVDGMEKNRAVEQRRAVYAKFSIDQTWKTLQRRDNWYCSLPMIGCQIGSFSDIEGVIVNYDHLSG